MTYDMVKDIEELRNTNFLELLSVTTVACTEPVPGHASRHEANAEDGDEHAEPQDEHDDDVVVVGPIRHRRAHLAGPP